MTRSRGFTLIELAIVLVIITILIGGLAMPLSAQIQARRIGETKKTLEEAREAIIGYAMTHTISKKCTCSYDSDGELSSASTCELSSASAWCSARGTPDQSSTEIYIRHYLPCSNLDGKGTEALRDSGGRCPKTEGYLPWVDLGVAPHDAWGNRLLYAVTGTYSRSTGFSNTEPGDLQICGASANIGFSDCSVQVDVAKDVPVVILSHGPNGWGALNINGNKLADPASNDEKENANTTTVDKEFVSRPPSRTGDAAGEFDDLVVWISDGLLRSRVCPAGGCP